MYLEKKSIKFVNVGDLHLYDKEIGATINYVEESSRNLGKVIDYYKENEDIDFVVLGGDIQHGKPNDLREMSRWRSLLIELRDLVYERMSGRGLLEEVTIYDAKGNEFDLDEQSILFSLKGNHDYNRREPRDKSFTFFDDLVEANILSVPKVLVYGDKQVNFYSSEECQHPVEVGNEISGVVGIYHDPIIQDGRLVDTYMGKMISPDEHKFFNRVDLAILNDIHLPIAPYRVVTTNEDDSEGYETCVITPGSIGRTSFSDSHKRDFALMVEVTLDYEEGEINYSLEQMDLLPYKELFDYEKVIKVKRRENMFEEFSLEIEKVDRVRTTPLEDIENMELDEDVKKLCVELLEDITREDK